MPRALTAARATVLPGRESEYLRLVARLAARMRARGEHFWLFRNPEAPAVFLEFSESRNAGTHWSRAVRDADEEALEQSLTNLVTYAPDRRVLWAEVSLEEY